MNETYEIRASVPAAPNHKGGTLVDAQARTTSECCEINGGAARTLLLLGFVLVLNSLGSPSRPFVNGSGWELWLRCGSAVAGLTLIAIVWFRLIASLRRRSQRG